MMTSKALFFGILLFTISAVHCDIYHSLGDITLKYVSTSVNHIWGINADQEIFKCDRPCTGNWVKISGSLTQLDVGDEEVWGVNSDYLIYKRPADGSGDWVNVKGGLKHVSASGNGYIWGVNYYDQIYKCKKPCNGDWIGVDGRLKQIDGGHNYVYGVNSGDSIYTRPIDGSGSWRWIPGQLQHITAAGRADIFGVNSANNVYRCTKPCVTGQWELMEGSLKQCDATFDSFVGVSAVNSAFEHGTGI